MAYMLDRESLPANVSRLRERIGRRIAGRYATWSFSQEGEDRILARLLEGHGPGFYVDVGAHHPQRFSNTYLLYQQGWRGVAIDASPATAAAFRRLRPRDIAVTIALGDRSDECAYFEFNDSALNTLSADRAKSLVETTDYRIIRETRVPVDRLGNTLRMHVPVNTHIDLLSVDVEGMDEEVLRTNDWQQFRPTIVIAELTGLDSISEVVDHRVSELLADHGYVPYAKTRNSVLFVERNP